MHLGVITISREALNGEDTLAHPLAGVARVVRLVDGGSHKVARAVNGSGGSSARRLGLPPRLLRPSVATKTLNWYSGAENPAWKAPSAVLHRVQSRARCANFSSWRSDAHGHDSHEVVWCAPGGVESVGAARKPPAAESEGLRVI